LDYLFNPLAYGVDAIRGSLTGVHYFSYYADFAVLAICVVALVALGGYFFSKVELRLKAKKWITPLAGFFGLSYYI